MDALEGLVLAEAEFDSGHLVRMSRVELQTLLTGGMAR
jgi:hypothetical protein